MRYLLLNQFYPADAAPTGVVLEALAERLAEQGHTVKVLCGAGGYAEMADFQTKAARVSGTFGSIEVIRLASLSIGRRSHAGKLLNYFLYYCGVTCYLLWTPADLVVALTTPPYLSLLARAVTRLRGGRHAHWIMDLYPDVMVAHGMLRRGGLPHRLLRGLTKWGFGGNRCAAVLTLGPMMAEKIRLYLSKNQKAHWVPLWGCEGGEGMAREVAELRALRGWGTDEVVFLYSGNMGLGHRLQESIAAAQILATRGERIRLAFYGNGKRKAEVEAALEKWGHGFASVGGYVDRQDLSAHLSSGDVHLASLDPAWDGTMLPSKLQGIFAAGRPVIFTGSRTGDVGRWILESGAGWVCAPEDIDAHVAAMLEALDPCVRERMGAAARKFSEKWFNKEVNVARICALLTEKE
ncbi:MAG: glycosyltransferase family 4 protein [Verrucomicrobiaceae bacterium]